MLQNKKVNAVIAIVAAIIVWAYVVGMVDPGVTKRFTDIPIQLVNQESLIQDGMAVDSTDITAIDVTVSGDRADVNKIDAEDIQVTADLYGRHEGSNYVSLEVQLPRGISLDSRSEDRIVINVGELVTDEKTVEATLTGSVSENSGMGDVTVSPEAMTIYGTRGNVDKVDRLEAEVNFKLLGSSESTHDVAVKAVDSSGKEVPFVITAQSTVSVTARLVQHKEVPLKVDTTGDVADGYELTGVDAPKTIRIEGSAEAVSKIDSVTAEDIDVSGLTESKQVKINIDLPDGVKVAKEEDLYATVNVAAPSTAEFTFSGNEITIEGLHDNMSADISGSITVTAKGQIDKVNALTKGNITLKVDVSGLEAGTHTVGVTADADGVELELSPSSVEVTIEEK